MSKIAVDVTPLLPGGINGGAKPMVLAVLQELPRIFADDQFILLTADHSHDELAFLDQPNVRRVCVHKAATAQPRNKTFSGRAIVDQFRIWILGQLSQRIKQVLRTAYYYYLPKSIMTSNSIVRQLGADFLFCPFGAPKYYALNVPVLSVVYDLQFLNYPAFFTNDEFFFRRFHFDQICQLADHVVTISEFTRQAVLQNSFFLPEQVTTIHIGLLHDYSNEIDPSEIQKVLNRLELETQHYLLYPANFWAHKNHTTLLKGFHLFRKKFPGSDLKIVCTGALEERRSAFFAEAKNMGLNQYIIAPGFLPDREIGILFQGAKGLIFPSLYEGFGMPLLEAMQAGIPIACSNVTSLPEIGGDSVLYFNPEKLSEICSAIEALEFNEVLCSELIQKGYERLKSFGNTQNMAKNYGGLIHRILDGKEKI